MNSDNVEEILRKYCINIKTTTLDVGLHKEKRDPPKVENSLDELKAALLALLEAEAEILRVQKGNARASVMMEIKAIPLERIKELFGV